MTITGKEWRVSQALGNSTLFQVVFYGIRLSLRKTWFVNCELRICGFFPLGPSKPLGDPSNEIVGGNCEMY